MASTLGFVLGKRAFTKERTGQMLGFTCGPSRTPTLQVLTPSDARDTFAPCHGVRAVADTFDPKRFFDWPVYPSIGWTVTKKHPIFLGKFFRHEHLTAFGVRVHADTVVFLTFSGLLVALSHDGNGSRMPPDVTMMHRPAYRRPLATAARAVSSRGTRHPTRRLANVTSRTPRDS
jgi:hypothetical protein